MSKALLCVPYNTALQGNQCQSMLCIRRTAMTVSVFPCRWNYKQDGQPYCMG